MSTVEEQLAEWRAKRDASRNRKPLVALSNGPRPAQPAIRSGQKLKVARSPEGAENRATPDLAKQQATFRQPSSSRPGYLVPTKASIARFPPTTSAGDGADEANVSQPQASVQSTQALAARVGQPAAQRPGQPEAASKSQPAAASRTQPPADGGMNDDLLQPEDGVPEASGPCGPSSSIAARLEALRREAAVGISSSAAAQSASIWANGGGASQPDRSLAALAEELFEDATFKAACHKGNNCRLQRTKDGATQESRIHELASMVRLLRVNFMQLTAKNKEFVAHSLKFEKNSAQQIEAVKLASESTRKHLEAGLANAKRDAAQAATAHKSAVAVWSGDVEFHKAEVSRVKRELERVEGERARALEDARRSESARAELDAAFDQHKKETAQTISALREQHSAANGTGTRLQVELESIRTAEAQAKQQCSAAEARCRQLQLDGKQMRAELDSLREAHNALRSDNLKMGTQVAEAQARHAELAASAQRTERELRAQQEQGAALVAQLESSRATAATAAAAASEAAAAAAGDYARLQGRCTALEEHCSALEQQEASLAEEKAQLKAGLTAALVQQASLEAEHSDVNSQLESLQSQVEELTAAEAHKAQQLDALQSQLAAAQADFETAREEAAAAARRADEAEEKTAEVETEMSERTARLSHLEGELEAFQDVIGEGDQSEMLSRLVSKVACLDTALAEEQARRRGLHNQLVRLRGNVRVFCRLRPAAASRATCQADGVSLALTAEDGRSHPFSFDKVFGPNASQASIFGEVAELVQSALDGYQVCLFSFGQTGAGKTHTMQGSASPDGRGITPRALDQILQSVAALREQGWKYNLEASFLEVYNEQLRDLLAPGNGRHSAAKALDHAAIKHDASGGGTSVAGATRAVISCAEDAEEVTRRAAAARACEATAMNATSSRSHSVLTLFIVGHHEATNTRLSGSLSLVDLAGSERLARSEVAGARQKEACNINKSLSALGDVFAALASKASHVPYRNSKLTHLLQPCLGGDGKTLMFVNINPEPASVGESLCSLRFAAKVNACETGAKGGAKRHMLTAGGDAAPLPSQGLGGAKRKPLAAAAARNVKSRF